MNICVANSLDVRGLNIGRWLVDDDDDDDDGDYMELISSRTA